MFDILDRSADHVQKRQSGVYIRNRRGVNDSRS